MIMPQPSYLNVISEGCYNIVARQKMSSLLMLHGQGRKYHLMRGSLSHWMPECFFDVYFVHFQDSSVFSMRQCAVRSTSRGNYNELSPVPGHSPGHFSDFNSVC